MAKNYPPKLKFQIVLELLQGEHGVGQLARSYSVHPNSILNLGVSTDFIKFGSLLLECCCEILA